MRKILVDFSSSGDIHRIFGWSPKMQKLNLKKQARRRGGSRGSNELPLEVNNGGLKTQTVDF